MTYNFQGIADDMLMKFEKKIDLQIKQTILEFAKALILLCDLMPPEKHKEVITELSDALWDSKSTLLATSVQASNKVVRIVQQNF